MKGKKLAAQVLIVAMLAYQIPVGAAAAGSLPGGGGNSMATGDGAATPSGVKSPGLATPGDVQANMGEEGGKKPGGGNVPGDGGTPENGKAPETMPMPQAEKTAATASNALVFGTGRGYGMKGEYQLEAEDTTIASYDNVNPNGDGNRVELQQNGSVTFDLGKIADFKEGKYLVLVHMNGSSGLVKLLVNGGEKGEIKKGPSGWGYEDLAEYSYCLLELKQNDQLAIAEGQGDYAHLDWVKLHCLEADYWIEAEDTFVVSYGGGAGIHGDQDRVEVNGGGNLTFDLSKVSGFQPGMYEIYAGVNGARTQWEVMVDGAAAGRIMSPGGGKWEKGTCVDVGLGAEARLSGDSMVRLADMDQSWGHVDYLRLIRTGESTPKPEGEYQLEAEDKKVASYVNANENTSEGNRMELQPSGSVTYDLSKVPDFEAGKYLVMVKMNGNSKVIRLLVNGNLTGTITKAEEEGSWWEYSAMAEYYYHGELELDGSETVSIEEGEGKYTHLDWMKLIRVDTCYWVEAEDISAVFYGGDAKIHGEQDRVEVNGGGSVSFDLSKTDGFQSGVYKLYAGVNGARTQWGLSVDREPVAGSLAAPGGGKFQQGTCKDVGFESEIELSKSSILKFSDVDGSWGHLDYIRLIRTGDATPRFDETHEPTGIRVTAPKGFFPDGSGIVVEAVSRPVRQEIREAFKGAGQKVFFYRFHIQMPSSRHSRQGSGDGGRLDMAKDMDGEAMGYLPVPEGYSDECELYFAPEPGDDLEPMPGTWLEGRRLCFQMEPHEGVYGGVYLIVDEDAWKFEGEKYYYKNTDGGAAADLQPSEEIHFPIPDDEAFEGGRYNLLLRVCGGQNYKVLVDGEEKAAIERGGTGWGDYGICVPDRVLNLSKGQTVTIKADNHFGWVDYMSLKPGKTFAEESAGVEVEAEAGVVPAGATLFVEPADDMVLETVWGIFGFTQESAPAMSFYTISLEMDGAQVGPSGALRIRIPIPEGFTSGQTGRLARAVDSKENLSLFLVKEDGKKIKVPFELAGDGQYVEFEARDLGLYGLINQNSKNELYYPAMDYYDKAAGEQGQYADLQPGDAFAIPVKDLDGFAESNYMLSVRSSGNRTKLMVLVNGVPVGMASRDKTDWEDMNEAKLPFVLSLKQEDVITIYAPGFSGAGPYGWVDYVKLEETGQAAQEAPPPISKITLEAEDFYPDELEAGGKVANVNHPSKKVEFPILAADGFAENDYHFTLYTTGVMENWAVCVNGVQVLSGTRAGSGYEMRHITRELGDERIHLKPGDILTVEFLEQDTDNYGNWVDKIVLNSRRKVSGERFLGRTGGRILTELAGDFEAGAQPHTSVEDGRLTYQGEAYYRAQNDNPAADLQPGEQILIPVSDHGKFAEGSYRLTVRSCGNREFFRIKVNGWLVGTVTRKETGYGMGEMTDDTMETPVDLKPGDMLAIEGQTGGKYGWVDSVALSRIPSQATAGKGDAKENYSWEAEDYYPKQKDNPAADLQPGDEIVIPLNTNEAFPGGDFYLAVVGNGNRTALVIKKNGERIGSITRNETDFDMGSVTMDVLQRPIHVDLEDVISICAPGDESGPYGWVDRMVLMPVPGPHPQGQEEYRYPAWAYGTASLYLPAADLQPGEALKVPLGDHLSFMEGQYQLAVISNGTREQFGIRVNGQPVGNIFRRPSDYGDNGMSRDPLDKVLYLKPSDEIEVVGQDGEFFGWVSALVLEPVE